MTSPTRQPKARVVLRTTADERAPGTVTAIIDDAQNIAASTYYNSPGEFHMTLPLLHPQAGKCEPWRTHYAVEEHVNGLWVQRFHGILSDFDANENDIIVYGIDYIGLLGRVIDTRYVQGSPELPPPTGSKYISQTISAIISDLLTYAKAKQNTPVRFIPLGPIDSFPEVVTIYSTFTGITEMIFGLVDSHRQGTGKRSRFYAEHLGGGLYFQWRLADNPGVDRPNLRMEYGGLVQGFQAIGFGDWAVKAHGIGRTQTGYELFYQTASAPGVDYTSANGYPAIETADVYDNVADLNDLQRRVKQKAMTASRIGKRIALGLRSEVLSPFDGYDIADSVPINIQRGAIDTTRWGSGYWSIYGVEWRVKQDGSAETTLVVSPKEVAQAINADTLTDNEALPAPIETVRIADGAIDPSKLADGAVTTPKLADTAVTNEKVADDAIGTGQIQPLAVTNAELAPAAVQTSNFDPAAAAPRVNNAPLAPLTANVVIDEDGIHITDGALYLSDYGGQSVLGPAGFDGSWVEFITNGVYNGGFLAGITNWTVEGTLGSGAIAKAISIVSGADSMADYLASLSAAIPYWIISAYSSTNLDLLAQIMADSNGRYVMIERPTGGAATFGGHITLMTDVPVVEGVSYDLKYRVEASLAGGADTGEVEVSRGWRTSTHAELLAEVSMSTREWGISNADGEWLIALGQAPVNAKYARLTFRFELADSASGLGALILFYGASVTPKVWSSDLRIGLWEVLGLEGAHLFDTMAAPNLGRLRIGGGNGVYVRNLNYVGVGSPALLVGEGGIGWVDDDATPAVDMTLVRSAAGVLTSSGRLRLAPEDDVSLSSTQHAFQIGPSGGTNLAMDGNEIMARLNGAASTLHLNNDGGNVAVGIGGLTATGVVQGGYLRAGPGNLSIRTLEISLTIGGTTFIPDASIGRSGFGMIGSAGNNGMMFVQWYRHGSFNYIGAIYPDLPTGWWEARGGTFTPGANPFSYYIESNAVGARLAVKNNSGFATTHRLIIFADA